jgi:V/A-type H+-transporting ATPase subunit E
MGSEALATVVEAEGRARVAAIHAEAAAEADALRANAEREARRRGDEVLVVRERELRADAHARIAEVRVETRRSVLEARQRLLERIFALAREALPSALETPAAQTTLSERARSALERAPAGPIAIRCSPAAMTAVEVAAAGRENVSVERDDALPAGFQLSAAAGALIVDATLERLLDLQRASLAIELMRRIDEETAR